MMKNLSKILIAVVSVSLFGLFIYFVTTEQTQDKVKVENNINDSINLRFGHNTPIDSALHQAALRFSEKVKKKTNGEVIIDVFPAQELGNDHQMVEMARQGELDIILTPTAKMSVAVPSMQYADLPFYFPTREDLYNMLDGKPGQMILDDMKSIGLVGVTFWENGFKQLTANFPILSPSDLEGKKFRVMKSRIIMEQFRSFGAEALPIDFHATKKALSDKIVDGQENPLIAIVSMGFHEVQTDLVLSDHAFLGYVLSFSDKTLEKLPNSICSVLIETAKEVTPWEREETQKREKKLLKTIVDSGVKVHRLTLEQRMEFSKLVSHIPEEFESIIGVDVMSKTKELLYKKYGAFLKNEEHVLIGINADASLDGNVAALEIKRGVELAVAEINQEGGVLGKPIEVILKDHMVMPSKGIQNIKEFSKNENLIAVIGGKHSAVIAEELDIINILKVPYLIPWAATGKIVNNAYDENYIFRISANDELASHYIAENALKNYKSPAIVVGNSIWGRDNLISMEQYFEKKGQKFSSKFVVSRGQENFEKVVSKILDSGSKSLVMVLNAQEASKLTQELYKQNKTLPILSHWGIIGGNFFKENKNILVELDLKFFQTFSFSHKQTKASQNLLNMYKKRYKTQKAQIDFAVAQAYDLTKMLALAIKKADSLDREKIKTALENLPDYKGAVKTYSPAFTKKSHDALNTRDFKIGKFHSDGTIVFEVR